MPDEVFKIFRRLLDGTEVFVCDFSPPAGQVYLLVGDLEKLQLEPGFYVVEVPLSLREQFCLPAHQEIFLPAAKAGKST